MKQFVDKEKLNRKQKKPQPQPTHQEKEQQKKRGKPSRKQKMQQKRKIKMQNLKESKSSLDQHLAAAQSSTKSVGRFDKKAHQEQKQHKVKRRKQYSNFNNIDEQIARNKEIFDVVKQSGLKKLQHAL